MSDLHDLEGSLSLSVTIGNFTNMPELPPGLEAPLTYAFLMPQAPLSKEEGCSQLTWHSSWRWW